MILKTREELTEEMFDEWLWDRSFDKFDSIATRQVEKELGFWRSIWGARQKIIDRHWKLFEEFRNNLKDAKRDNGE